MPASRPPILREFPESFDTERLLIRAPRPGDSRLTIDAIRNRRLTGGGVTMMKDEHVGYLAPVDEIVYQRIKP